MKISEMRKLAELMTDSDYETRKKACEEFEKYINPKTLKKAEEMLERRIKHDKAMSDLQQMRKKIKKELS